MRAYIVPHTHWDREWYITFQQFRHKLVGLVDQVLGILQRDPGFSHFTLDGQAVILEDYLAIRPERRTEIEQAVRGGRLLVGPWYVLPDEFLVSGESLVRNLQRGIGICRGFGGPMMVGYVPDQFGHIAQLPQILKNAGIDSAVLWRGVGGECRDAQFWWESPDGTRVRCIYLPDSYSNAAALPPTAAELAEAIAQLVENQRGYLSADAVLLMNGSDHRLPQPYLPRLLQETGRELQMELQISTLPAYIEAVSGPEARMPVIRGELRSGERAPLLVSCASSRIPQKQRNHAVETLLEKYAEPLAAWARLCGAPCSRGFLAESRRLLLQNHPHDSICGCSNDQVHREIETRFDWAEQIALQVREESLSFLSRKIDTGWFSGNAGIVVYNPHPRRISGLVEAELPEIEGESVTAVVDQDGTATPWQPAGAGSGSVYFTISLTPLQARAALGWVGGREIQGLYLNGVKLSGPADGELKVDFLMGTTPVGDLDIDRLKKEALAIFKDKSVRRVHVVARQAGERGVFIARDVPGCGWRGFEAAGMPGLAAGSEIRVSRAEMENSLYRVRFNRDGTLDLLVKESGMALRGLHRLVDGGDRGDLYTFTSPEKDRLVSGPHRALAGRKVKVEVLERGPVRASVRLTQSCRLPASLAGDRRERSRKTVSCRIAVTVSLVAGSPGVHFQTNVENSARDHRLRVHFPAPFVTGEAWADGHFAVERRTAQPPPGDYSGWAEKPDGLAPQKSFVSIDNGSLGLSLVNEGLPEYEVLPGADGRSTEIALTLLRCVGWLSRDDLSNRPGHAGPAVETPAAQCPGSHTFKYSLVPHRGNWREAGVKQLAAVLNAPLIGAATGKNKGKLPAQYAALSVEPPEIVLSCAGQAESSGGILARFFNCSDAAREAVITPGFPFKEAVPINFLEEPSGPPLAAVNGSLALTVRPWEIISLVFVTEE